MTVTGEQDHTTTRTGVARPWSRRRRALVATAALLATAATMAATGIGTGAGPLGSDGGATVGLHRASPATFTVGFHLPPSRWFDVHIESVRPLARGDAANGMPLRELSLTTDLKAAEVGFVDGAAEDMAPRTVRRPAKGFVIPRGEVLPGSGAFGLATFEIVETGSWRYEGFEVVYRHGLVRHRAVTRMNVEGCPPVDDRCAQR